MTTLLAMLPMLAVVAVFDIALAVWALHLARRGEAEHIACADLTNPRGPR